jgi:hypothetical protein
VQGFEPYDRMAWPIYEVIAEHKLPMVSTVAIRASAAACLAAADTRIPSTRGVPVNDR